MSEERRRQTISYTCTGCGHNYSRRQFAGRGSYCPRCHVHSSGPATDEAVTARMRLQEEKRRRREERRKDKPPPEKRETTSIGDGPDVDEETETPSETPKTDEERHAGILF